MDIPLDSPVEGAQSTPTDTAAAVRPRLRPLPALKLATLPAATDSGLVCAIDDPDCIAPDELSPEEATE